MGLLSPKINVQKKKRVREKSLWLVKNSQQPEKEKKMKGFFLNILDQLWWNLFYSEVVRKVQPGEVQKKYEF